MRIGLLPEHLYGDAVALWEETGLTRPWNDPEADLRRAVTGSASTVLAGVEGDALLATAMLGHDGHRGWVYYLAVAPRVQRRGVGRQMMRACEEWVRVREFRDNGRVSWLARRLRRSGQELHAKPRGASKPPVAGDEGDVEMSGDKDVQRVGDRDVAPHSPRVFEQRCSVDPADFELEHVI